MRLIDRYRSTAGDVERSSAISFDEYLELLGGGWTTSWGSQPGHERVASTFAGYAAGAYAGNGVVFACILARLMLFSEATFAWRDRVNGRPGKLFTTPELAILERPWAGGTTGDLLARIEQDVSLAGNAYIARPIVGVGRGGRPQRADFLRRLRPDWVEIIVDDGAGDPDGIKAQVVGYLYTPRETNGRAKGDPQVLLPDEVAHIAPIPDPLAHARGMSWLTPVVREIESDSMMTEHKAKFFKNAATPNLLLKAPTKLDPDVRKRLEKRLAERHQGAANAYRTMVLESGLDATVVGHSFEQMAFSVTQAAGENRIAAAAGVPGIVVGLREGLQAATYSNFAQAMRRWSDVSIRPAWRNTAGSLAALLDLPATAGPGLHLWYDDRDIPALQTDVKDRAEVQLTQANTIGSLIRSGYTAASSSAAVLANDMGLLEHTGLVPVTLMPPGQEPGGTDAGGTDPVVGDVPTA